MPVVSCEDSQEIRGCCELPLLVPGATAPKLISAQTVKAMKPGTVIVDVAIDQGGCAETSRPTTHSHPTFVVDDVVHYCVTNMPGAVPRTSTFALTNATTSFILALADKGWRRALHDDPHLRDGDLPKADIG